MSRKGCEWSNPSLAGAFSYSPSININMDAITGEKKPLQKVYNFAQTNIGIGLLLLLYAFLSYPVGWDSVDVLFEVFGGIVGTLLLSSVIILVLSRKFKWNTRQKILHTLLILFFLPFIPESLYTLKNIIFISFLIIEVGIIIADLFKSIFRRNKK